MAGTAQHQDPHAFIHVRPAKVIGELVAIIRQFRPQVLITFDETGGYWHILIISLSISMPPEHSMPQPMEYNTQSWGLVMPFPNCIMPPLHIDKL